MSKNLKQFLKEIMDDCDNLEASSIVPWTIKQIFDVYDSGNRAGYVYYQSKNKQLVAIIADVTILIN